MRDVLPLEAELYRRVEDRLRETFELWGYREVRSPAIEYADVLSIGVGSKLADDMFKFQDVDGKMLALRAEMTIPAARIATGRLSSMPKPLRLCYIANVFRRRTRVGQPREFWQAGAELVGKGGADGDAEVLALLISALNSIGLKDFRIDASHASILKELAEKLGLSAEEKTLFFEVASHKDFSRVDAFLGEKGAPGDLAEAVKKMFKCSRVAELGEALGDLEAYPSAKRCVANLLEINERVKDLGVKAELFFDFALTKGIEYYTGIVFEASLPALGFPIAGGGRYDDLLKNFGEDLPATGFAIDVDACVEALKKLGQPPAPRRRKALLSAGSLKAGGRLASRLRELGVAAILSTEADEERLRRLAESYGADLVIKLRGEEALLMDAREGGVRKVKVGEVERLIVEGASDERGY